MNDHIAENPFRTTKSNDLTDEQIEQLWVSVAGEGSVTGLARPDSRTPGFILGGKGSGKSHLMRYYSFPLQKIRCMRGKISLVEGIKTDGFIGVYIRCSGLNADRFKDKGQSESTWTTLFAYYLELWVADEILNIIEQVVTSLDDRELAEAVLAGEAGKLFDRDVGTFSSIVALRDFISNQRKALDYAINNVDFTGKLNCEILLTRGAFLFGLPRIFCEYSAELNDITFTYFLDEFENFSEIRQIYINTLIREKSGPVSFKVGARLYGVRTHRTLSGGEMNVLGSEYEELRLDERFRNNEAAYNKFCSKLVFRRLEALQSWRGDTPEDAELKNLEGFFDEPDLSLESPLFVKAVGTKVSAERSHFKKLIKSLQQGCREDLVVGIKNDVDVHEVVDLLSFPEYPLLEKLAILHVYQKWYRGADVRDAAAAARENALAHLSDSADEKFSEFVSKHIGDMSAQLLRENDQKQIYAGIRRFVRMSEGIPRALITILKQCYDWSTYSGEGAFGYGKISIRSQQKGVVEAAEWFLDQMLMEGEDGVRVRSAVSRLAELFRVNRFSDKPIETSAIAFSANELHMHPEPRRVLKLAKDTSLLIDILGGQRERNSEKITNKVELNFMLSPKWDLPTARRGVVTFSAEEVNSIFDYDDLRRYEGMLREWREKMSAPAFGRPRNILGVRSHQPDLFE